jgi:hypothetical protein
MYIAFDLQNIYAPRLNAALHDWSDRYNTPYNTKTVRNIKRITFDSDETYTFFSMTWDHAQFPFSMNNLFK